MSGHIFSLAVLVCLKINEQRQLLSRFKYAFSLSDFKIAAPIAFFLTVLWIRIRIGFIFRCFVNPDPYSEYRFDPDGYR